MRVLHNKIRKEMIRDILGIMRSQRERINDIQTGDPSARQILAEYDAAILHYEQMDPGMFNSCVFPDILTALSEIGEVISEREQQIRGEPDQRVLSECGSVPS